MKYILMVILLSLPVSAYAWSDAGMHPVSTPFNPSQGQFIRHEIHMNVVPSVHPAPPHHQEPPRTAVHNAPVVRHTANYQVLQHNNRPVDRRHDPIIVDGQQYFYREGVFYQEVGDQLVAVVPVLGAVVDYIPQDYVVTMQDGINYLFTGGVYYERVPQGFEVVEGPASDQG